MERWSAQGNVYLVARARSGADVGDADGMVEVVAHGEDWAEVRIWNPDGSLAEMSGNGTRIAACWLVDSEPAESGSRSGSAHWRYVRACSPAGWSSRTWAT